MVKALCCWSDGPRIDSGWCELGFFPWLAPTEPCALGSTQPLKINTGDFSWGKGCRCLRLTTYHPCIIIIIFINCNRVITRWQWLFYMYTNMKKKVTRKFKSGGLHEKHVVANLETWEPFQHSLVDKRKPKKTCIEVAGRKTFRILTSNQQSGI